jgi:hypothetical protein
MTPRKKKPEKQKKIRLDLPVALDDKELRKRGDEMAQAELSAVAVRLRMGVEKDEAKRIKDHSEDELTALISRAGKLAREISKKEAIQPVDCEMLYAHDELKVVTVRKDTSEVVGVREMTPDEQQLLLGEEPLKLSAAIKKMIAQFEKQMKEDEKKKKEEDGEADEAG